MRVSLIAEVGQCLDPHVAIDRLLLQDEGIALANFEHIGRVLLLDVEVEELVLKILVLLTAIYNTLFATIYLEQEQHVVLINLGCIVALDEFIDSTSNLYKFVKQARIRRVHAVTTSFPFDLSIDTLLLYEVAFE